MEPATFGLLDITVFVLYFIGIVAFGLFMARREKNTTRDYFLAGDRLPWYVIGSSLTASNISAEHFVGMIGSAYAAGLVVANMEWGNFITYTMLVWVFLPYYLRGGLYTMPEFLERRFSKTTRYFFAVTTLLTYILGFNAAILYAGALVLQALFDMPLYAGVLLIAITTSIYTVYGGLLSVVWAEFVQCLVLFAGGITVTAFGLSRVGGLGALIREFPEKFHMVYPASHPEFPFVGMVGTVLSVSMWYVCTNQFMVQRCLGARSEWDARMGGITAGFYKLILPAIICLPGILAFKILGPGVNPNHVFALLVAELIPVGLVGLIMAGLASAIMSTVSSTLNAASTVVTMDLLKPLVYGEDADEAKLVKAGRWSGVILMVFAVAAALYFCNQQGQVFLIIQNIYSYFAAPVAALFILGIFWKGATATGATVTFLAGFALNEIVQRVIFKIPVFSAYDAFYNRGTVVFILSLLILFGVSLVTRKTDRKTVNEICWKITDLTLRDDGRSPHGTRSLAVFWALMVASILLVYLSLFILQWMTS